MVKINVPEAIARYEAGESAIQLADSFGVTRQAIYMAIADSERYQRLQQEKVTKRENCKKAVAQLLESGASKSSIAGKLGLSLRTVLYIAKELRGSDERRRE